MELLSAFHAKYPLLQVFLESGNSDLVYNKLLSCEVDVAIICRDYDDPRPDLVRLGRHEVIMFVSGGHPWAGRQQIELSELDRQRMIFREPGSVTRRALEELREKHRERLNVVMQIPRDAVREAVAAGLGVGIVSSSEFVSDDAVLRAGAVGVAGEPVSTLSCIDDENVPPGAQRLQGNDPSGIAPADDRDVMLHGMFRSWSSLCSMKG